MIHYQNTLTGITDSQLTGFFVGWPNPPSNQGLWDILRNAPHITLAIETETQRVIGFVYAISDGVLAAYIPLLEVLPEFQGQGIGKELVTQLLDQLSDFYMIDVCCDPELESYYARFGFMKTSGMIRRNYQNQSGKSR